MNSYRYRIINTGKNCFYIHLYSTVKCFIYIYFLNETGIFDLQVLRFLNQNTRNDSFPKTFLVILVLL